MKREKECGKLGANDSEVLFLQDIIQRCHKRRENPLRQHKTITKPSIRDYPQYTVYCSHDSPMLLSDVEQASISFTPIGRVPHDFGVQGISVGDNRRFVDRQGVLNWAVRRWENSWGVHIYTGMPSARYGANWHDIAFTYAAICATPDAVATCIEALVNSVANPLLTLTKSGGLRFSCRVSGYLHLESERLFAYQHTPASDNPYLRDVYLEVLGEKGYSRWDGRYEILLGNLLDPPLISKEILFAPINTLRSEIHQPVPHNLNTTHIPFSLGSPNLDTVKGVFLKRGFSYVKYENGFHHWTRFGSEINNTDVLLWESDGVVWIQTTTENAGLPLKATPITSVWSDSGLLAPIPPVSVSDKVIAVREGDLSPLALRRKRPVLSPPTENAQRTQIDFQRCSLSRNQLEEWIVNRRGDALGDFASALLDSLERKVEDQSLAVGRIRDIVQAFEVHASEVVQDMQDNTLWYQLKQFFSYYKRNADAPIRWDNKNLTFMISSEAVEVSPVQPLSLSGQVFQIRTGLYPHEVILDYGDTWSVVSVSKIGQRFFAGIRAEIESTAPHVKHTIVADWLILRKLNKILSEVDNVCFVTYAGEQIAGGTHPERADVVWFVGAPDMSRGTEWFNLWFKAQALYGNDDIPLHYDKDNNRCYRDPRVQRAYEDVLVSVVLQRLTQLKQGSKTILLTALEIPGITDTAILFDWEDFEVAGGLDRLSEVIATRERFEAERDSLTANTSRQEVERVLGCSDRQANRVLQRLRGGNIQRVPFRKQILSLLEDGGQKKTAELIESIDGNGEAIKHELTRLVRAGEIVRVQRGVYALNL